ncbi:hypothetical protein DL96DRAFT_1711814 [Flagelloscypha sp. PMI_526]|nr:hypothetical protein DL96DRAFT_1711814 [Flagelloscypha sp. PMI_526]
MDHILDVPEILFLVCTQVALSQPNRGRENLKAVALTNLRLSSPARDILLSLFMWTYTNSSCPSGIRGLRGDGRFKTLAVDIERCLYLCLSGKRKAKASFFVKKRQASFPSLRELLVDMSGAKTIPDLLFDVLFPMHTLDNVMFILEDIGTLERTICESLTQISATRISPRRIVLELNLDIMRLPTSGPGPEPEGNYILLPQSILALTELTNVDVHVTLDLADVQNLPSFDFNPALSSIARLGNVRSIAMVNREINCHVWTENVTVDPIHQVFQMLTTAPNEFCVDVFHGIKTEAFTSIHFDAEYTLAARASFAQVLELVPTSKHTWKRTWLSTSPLTWENNGYRYGFEGPVVSNIDLLSLASFRALENIMITYERGMKVGDYVINVLASD